MLTQLVSASVLFVAAATAFGASDLGASLASVGQISEALISHFGATAGRLVFSLGVLGASIVAAIVCSLALARRRHVTQQEIQLWRIMSMAATRRATPARETASKSRPDTPVEEAAAEAEFGMLHCMSRMIYNGCYTLAYGVVYPIVFIAQSLTQENPVMHGFRDGGKAAMDELSGG